MSQSSFNEMNYEFNSIFMSTLPYVLITTLCCHVPMDYPIQSTESMIPSETPDLSYVLLITLSFIFSLVAILPLIPTQTWSQHGNM